MSYVTQGEGMNKRLVTALIAVATGLTLTAGGCQSTEDDGCNWELDAYSASRPRPRPNLHKPSGNRVKPGVPHRAPQPTRKAPKGHKWEYNCD